jgi:hypothetical protein
MPLDIPSPTAAFSPTAVVLFEPAGRRGIATAPPSIEDSKPPIRPYRRWYTPQENPFLSQATGTGIETEPVGPVTERIVKKAVELWKKERETRAQVEDRLRELHIDALRNADAFSESSLADLRYFLDSLPLVERPSIFLLDDGNLRAVWRNAAKEQVGLQFLGAGVVQYVMFALRQQPPMMSRAAGMDALANIRRRIESNDYRRLLFG